MDAKELRIGNYIQDDKSRILEVDGVKKDDTIGVEIDAWPINGGGIVSLPLKPIPLTEQWLLDFGFDHIGIIFRKSVTHHLELVYMLSINEFRIQTKGNGFTNTLDIKHVHQLQNLYYSLTGEELTKK